MDDRKKRIALSLRIVESKNYDEKRDALSHDWPFILEKLNFPFIKYSCMGCRHGLFENSCHHSQKYLDSRFGKNRDFQKCFGITVMSLV